METSLLELADGLDVENKKKIKVDSYAFYLRNWLDGCVIHCNRGNLGVGLIE